MKTPDQLYPSLFHDVQMGEVLGDGKTFVDCIPLHSPQVINEAYDYFIEAGETDLKTFVLDHFTLPEQVASGRQNNDLPIYEHIQALWDTLTRHADLNQAASTLLPLPYPYVVPGGRFREIYYWDSYFTMLGLIQSKRLDLVKNMVDNFTHLIQTYGHIPNGNRTYFLSRSQPPFYALMYQLLADHDPTLPWSPYYRAMTQEYQFWMDGHASTSEGQAHRRFVHVQGYLLNRYHDDQAQARQESYLEDVTLAKEIDDQETFYRHIRAACESGWDFSSRWLRDPHDLSSIETSDLLPVDLNCLMWFLEDRLARFYDDAPLQAKYRAAADQRKRAITSLFWSEDAGIFSDYNWKKQERTNRSSAAMVYPLYFGLASDAQAKSVAQHLSKHYIKDGGLLTTPLHTTQQWDAPNGWAPLQWMAAKGLERYGHHDLCQRIASAWIFACEAKFNQDHKMIEKYNVLDPLATAKGGEYDAQDGFGWSNGVYLAFKAMIKDC